MRGTFVRTTLLLSLSLALAACGDDGGGEARPPTVANATLTTDEDAPVTQAIEASDPDGGTLTLTAATPMHGTVTVDRLMITYTPMPNYNGTDTFMVTVSDGMLGTTARVDVTVRPVNDQPAAMNDSFAAMEDMPAVKTHASLLTNDMDIDGDTLTITAVSNAMNGTVASAGSEVTFTPALNFSGNGSFQYTISDGKGGTATATVSLSIGGVNDPPVAIDDTASTQEDTAVGIPVATLALNDTDADNQTLTISAVSNPTHGTVALAGTTVTFTPALNYNGPATFQYTVTDGAASDTGQVTINVGAVNDLPDAVNDSSMTAEDVALVLPVTALVANDTDVDNTTLTITAVGSATGGAVALGGGNVTFTPTPNTSGAASFQYTLSDGVGGTDTATVAITVTPVNDAPVAGDDTTSTNEDVPVAVSTVSLLVNDMDIDSTALSITAVGGAVGGTVALGAGAITFTPAANFNGTGSFTYTLSDGTLSDTGAVTVNIASVNDAPVAHPDTAGVQTGNSLELAHTALLANDTDIDNLVLTIVAVQNPVNGTATLGATTVTFVPNEGHTGPASFDYVISDGMAQSTAKVTITVSATPICGDGTIAAPETCDDGNADGDDGCSATCDVEPGWICTGAPSACATDCGDGMAVGDEECDDANAVETDGCTTQCKDAAPCTVAALPAADRFAVDPATGHCYAAFDGEMTTHAQAQSACMDAGGYLVTITSASEQAIAHGVQNTGENPWIGAIDDANDTDAVFAWVTGEPFGFTAFAAGQPDDDAAFGGNGECLHMLDAAGDWNDTNCTIATFVVGRICELEADPCGDHVLQLQGGEECDDGNRTPGDGCSATCQLENGCGNGAIDPGEECDDNDNQGGDGCSATCQVEDGCGDGNLDPGEQCDDDNTKSGDGCSATCQRERLSIFTFTGAAGNEVSFNADGTVPAGLAALPVISRGGGISPSAAAGTFSASGFDNSATPTLNLMDYFSIVVTPAAGFALKLFSLELDERRSATGIRNWVVRSSLDGFTANLTAPFMVPDDADTRVDQKIPLGAAFGNITTAVEFRIYGYAAEAAAGTWRVDNVEIFGVTTPVVSP